MQDILIMEEVDVRRADDPTDSRVLTINKLAMPTLERETVEHKPGGGVGSVNFVLPMLKALQPTFSVKGLDFGTLAAFGFVPGVLDKWTFAASIRNTRTNKIIGARATIRGVISAWKPNEHTPGDVADCDHTFDEVTYGDLVIDGVEQYAWGFYERIARTGGVDWFAPYRIALGV